MEVVVTALFLGCVSVMDIQKKEIPLMLPLVAAGIGVLFQIIWVPTLGRCLESSVRFSYDWLAGGLFGALLLLAGRVTGEAIGYGDGIVVLSLGIWLGFFPVLEIFFLGLCLAALYGSVLFLSRRAGRKTQIPFLPFLLVSYGIWLVMGIEEICR